jgi:dCMP deaminase
MEVARLSAQESHCIRGKVGAVLVRNNFILATGRNGTLPGTDNCCEDTLEDGSLKTNDFTLHAEQNILTFCCREGISTKDTILFVTMLPCKMCAKLIASAGIKTVVYLEVYKDTSSIEFFKKAGIDCINFIEGF